MKQKWNAQTRIERPTFTSWHTTSMVSVIENDCGVIEVIGGEFRKDFTHLCVHLAYFVVILRPVFPHLGSVRMIGWQRGGSWVMLPLMRSRANLAFVTHREIKYGKEWGFVIRAISPMSITPTFIPSTSLTIKVVIRFRSVRGVIT